MTNKHTTLEVVLGGLMRRYQERVPAVNHVLSNMIQSGLVQSESEIENDHIAFRTMGVEHLGIQSFEKIFRHYGYERRDAYQFATKKLDAFWYAPPEDRFPRIFISELRVDDLGKDSSQILRSYTDEVTSDPVDAIDLNDGAAVDAFLHQGLWRTPTLDDYQKLSQESEYAAWVIYNRYYLNHFTVSVHNLPAPYNEISKFNEFLESIDVKLNDAGGKIKESPDGLLLQSSSVAEMVNAEFQTTDGEKVQHEIAGSYVEFAERRLLPEFASLAANQIERHHRREGFEAGNADKIFESTFRTQTGAE
ncbi:MAG: DUF1338 domain-containing protein [Pirellulaceae bacterium]